MILPKHYKEYLPYTNKQLDTNCVLKHVTSKNTAVFDWFVYHYHLLVHSRHHCSANFCSTLNVLSNIWVTRNLVPYVNNIEVLYSKHVFVRSRF